MTLCTTRPSRNTVSKKSFIAALKEADHQLEQTGSTFDPEHSTHRYNVYDIQHLKPHLIAGRDIASIEEWLQQHFVPDTADWMLTLEQHDVVDHFINHAQVYIHIALDKFQHTKAFIRAQLDIGFQHTFPAAPALELQQRDNAQIAREVVDQLKTMLPDPFRNPPTWRISLSTRLFESQMLCVLMSYGLVCVHFYRPHSPY